MLYAISTAAKRYQSFFHAPFLVQAKSNEEATQKGMDLALKAFPECEGYYSHTVGYTPPDQIIDDVDKITHVTLT